MRVILASQSPRRREILEKIGLTFEVIVSKIDETSIKGEGPRHYVKRVAREKVYEVLKKITDKKGTLIIGADTIVLIKGEVLGQPKDEKDAFKMLSLLQGKKHRVFTGLTILKDGEIEATDFSKSIVEFHPLTKDEINWYISTGEPFDKAGGYGVQGIGSLFIKKINGSFHNVMGFPVDLFYSLLKKVNLKLDEII